MKCHILSPITLTLLATLISATAAAQFINCENPPVLNCGDFIESNNFGEFQFVSSYGCLSPDPEWDGVEKLYTFTLECTSIVSISLTGLDDDLDLFLLGSCNPSDAINCSGNPDSEDESIIITLAEGTYYVSVDGWNQGSSKYFLAFECTATADLCAQAEPIECGVLVQSHNDLAGSNIDSYVCLDNQSGLETVDMTGAERIFQFSTPVVGDITITLDILSEEADLDVYATTQCCAFQDGSLIVDACNPSGGSDTEVVVWENAPAGTKYIIVDGYMDGSSAFTITVECCGLEETNCTIEGGDILPLGLTQTFADINGDGFLDLMQYEQGDFGTTLIIAYLYDPSFEYSPNLTDTVALGFIDFSLSSNYTVTDLNNDNLVDFVVIRGGIAGTWLSGIINLGNGQFEAVSINNPNASNIYTGTPVTGDIDNDGDQDIIACVDNGNCFAYINQGDNTFATRFLELCLDENITFEPKFIADIDKNGFNDLLGQRVDDSGQFEVCEIILYRDVNINCDDCLEPMVLPSELVQDIGDVDNDGDLDILASTKCDSAEPDAESEIQILVNEYPEPSFTFQPLVSIDLCVVCVAQSRLKDIDADGDLDLSATLVLGPSNFAVAIFENIDLSYHKIFELPNYLTVVWGDFDMDNEMDMSGILNNGETFQTYYASIENCGVNTPPEAPSGLSATTGSSGDVWLEWEAAFDAEQPDTSLTYNIFIVDASGDIVVSPLADTETGKRRIVRQGAQSQDTFWHYKNLPPGVYTWYVQAIDHACAGGKWSEAGSFEIGNCAMFEYKELDLGNFVSFGFNDIVMADFSLDDGTLLDLLFKASQGGTPNIFANQGSFQFQSLFTIDDDGDYVIGDLNTDNLMDVIVYDGGTYRMFFRNASGFAQTQSFEGGFSDPVIGDIDNDGDRDVIVGSTNHGGVFLIENQGNGNFASPQQVFFDPNSPGRNLREIFDADGDGDLDLLTSVPQIGLSALPVLQILYNTNGNLGSPSAIGEDLGLVAVGDLDNDGDKDILNAYTGDCVECMPDANLQVYINDKGNFSLGEVVIFPCDYTYDDIALGDLDQDGNLDLVSIQNENNFNTHLYVHRLDPDPDGTLVYHEIHEERFIYYFAIGDVDGDYDLDVVYPPIVNECGCLTALVNFSEDCPNTPPEAPGNVSCIVSGDSLIISWDAAVDAEQESQSLTYNIEVYYAASSDRLIVSPMSDRETGNRKLVRFGEQCHNLSWVIHGLDPDDYCVRVQAVDHAYAGGTWSVEVCCDFCPASSSSIAIAGDGTETTICRGDDNELLAFEYVLNNPESEAPYIFLVTDESGSIIGETDAQFDFSALDLGKYYVYGVSYFDDLSYETGTHISNIESTVCDSLSTDTICVRIDMADIVFLPNLRICAGEAIPIVASTNGETCAWDPAVGLDLSEPCFPTANPLVTTEYTVTVTTAYGCQTTANVTVIVDPLPVITVPDVTICEGEDALLEVMPPGVGTCLWTPSPTLDPAGCTAVATPEITTSYIVVVTDFNGCTATAMPTVTVVDQPEADPGPDVEICAGECVTLTGTGNVNCTWLDGTTAVGTDCDVVVCPDQTTTYTLIVFGSENCADTAEVTVTVYEQPVANAGNDILICEGDGPVDLNGSGGSECIWYDSDGNVIANTCATTVDVPASTFFVVEVREVNAQITCADVDTVNVEVAPVPRVVVQGDTTVCSGEEVMLVADVDCEDCMCFWDPETGLQDPGSCLPMALPPVGTTTYILRAVDINGCETTGSIDVTVIQLPAAVVINDHYVLHQNRSEVFNVMLNDEVDGTWEAVLVSGSPDVDISISPNGNATVTTGSDFLGRTTFEYQLIDPACGALSEIGIAEVVVIENDLVALCDPGLETVGCTILSNIEDYPGNRITIFNRYGNIVHLDSPYENDWDGLNVETGEPVPTGSYYFVLELGEDVSGVDGGVIKGVLLIVRQGG